jgi:hypothetical protein|tara:strand:- start:586 stop:780 length:195 start_codon:yes stop_codon:yes gene_type:complete
MPATYYDSATGTITYQRALRELRDHCFCTELGSPDLDTFITECWDKHAKGDRIPSKAVLHWLGY